MSTYTMFMHTRLSGFYSGSQGVARIHTAELSFN